MGQSNEIREWEKGVTKEGSGIRGRNSGGKLEESCYEIDHKERNAQEGIRI